MPVTTVFTNNRSQAVRLPAEVRLPDGVRRVEIRVLEHERIIAPAEHAWDSFFHQTPAAPEDFMPERASQAQREREAL